MIYAAQAKALMDIMDPILVTLIKIRQLIVSDGPWLTAQTEAYVIDDYVPTEYMDVQARLFKDDGGLVKTCIMKYNSGSAGGIEMGNSE